MSKASQKGETPKKSEKKAGKSAETPWMIPSDHPWANLWKMWAGVASVGAILTGYGYTTAPERFPFAYTTAFAWGLTLALGGLFFVILQHLTRAGWSVVVRRGAEHLAGTLPLFVLLFIPLWLFKETLYPWANHHHMHHPLIVAKASYLNVPFWSGRAVFYLGAWSFLSWKFTSLSRQQDSSGDISLTNRMQWMAGPAMLTFALTITFAGFDWLMSMDPEWYSTMFGVYIFSGIVISVMAFLSLFYRRAQASGLLVGKVTEEHFHDLGKLLFAFTIFWAYISYSQYFLIWYANIPEETVFFLHRGMHGWDTYSWVLVVGHFFFPFFLMLSRHAKRITAVHSFGAFWVLVMHFLDMYWLITPMMKPEGEHTPGFHPNYPLDIGCWMLVAGLMFTLMFRRMVTEPIVPARDPRLQRSLQFENA
jgi:hypothetical protein